LTLDAANVVNAPENARVELLGYNQPVKFAVNENKTLTLTPPELPEAQRPSKYAFAFKLTGFELDANPFFAPNSIELAVDKALVDGDQLRAAQAGAPAVVRLSQGSIHWLVKISQAGDYRVLYEAGAGPTRRLRLTGADAPLEFEVAGGENAEQLSMRSAGAIRFENPGVFHLSLQPADAAAVRRAGRRGRGRRGGRGGVNAVAISQIQLAQVDPQAEE
jgi:hypothetical protein